MRQFTTLRVATYLLPLFVLVGILEPSSGASDHTVTAIGSFRCYDGSYDTGINNPIVPLSSARIEMWDSDCDGSTVCDEKMGQAHINEDGSFSVTGRGGDIFSGPDVYLRVVYNDDDGVRLTDELNDDRSVTTGLHDHNDVGDGTIDFGAWTIGLDVGKGNASKCAVWLSAHNAYRDYHSLMSGVPLAGHYDVEYWSAIWSGTPWTNTDTTHWPIHYTTGASRHEFAHSVRHAADGDSSHFNWDVTRFRYARSHSICDANSNRIGTDTREMGLAYGFNEGWAEYWEGRTQGCWSVTIDPENEGNNAFALNVLSNRPDVGRLRMVQVLLAHPGQIHSLDEFVGFLAPTVSSTSSALISGIRDARRMTAKAPAVAVVPTAVQYAAVQRQIIEGERALSSEQHELAMAQAKARRTNLSCLQSNCEEAFATVAAPGLIRAQIELNRLSLDRLKSSITPDYQSQMRKQVEEGTFDGTKAALQQQYRAQTIRVTLTALKQVLDDEIPLLVRSPDARPLGLAMRTQLTQLQEGVVPSRPLPTNLGSNLVIKEDQATRTTFR